MLRWLILSLILYMPMSAMASDWAAYTSMSNVNSVALSGDFVWAATSGGVLKFNLRDSSYTSFTSVDGLSDNEVLCAEYGDDGAVWFGTAAGGLNRIDPVTNKVTVFDDFKGFRINAICSYSGDFYIGTVFGVSLFVYKPERNDWEIKENYRQLGDLPKDTEALSLHIFDGRIWVGTTRGIACADLSQHNLQDPLSWSLNRFIGSVRAIVDFDSTLYSGSSGGVFRLVAAPTGWARDGFDHYVNAMAVYDTVLVAGTTVGLQMRSSSGWRSIPVSIGRVLSLASETGGLWVGTGGGGLAKLEGRSITFSLNPNSSPGERFIDLSVDRNGVLWVATAISDWEGGNGIYRFGEGIWTHYVGSELPMNVVVATAIDKLGRVWFGTWGKGAVLLEDDGVPDKDNDKITSIDRNNSPLVPTVSYHFVVVNGIEIDYQGNIWMLNRTAEESTLPVPRAGLVVMDDFPYSESQIFTVDQDSLPSGEGTALATDKDGIVWYGTRRDGFVLLDTGGTPFSKDDDKVVSFSTSTHEDMTSNYITSIAVDSSGTLWVGTDGGLNSVMGTYSRLSGTYDVDSWETYGLRDGLPSEIINDILVDPWNNKWLATDNGLVRISADGGTLEVYNSANSGLVWDEIYSLAIDVESGFLWIGTAKGLGRLKLSLAPINNGENYVKVYPNPAIIPFGSQINFTNLPEGAIVKIFSPSGEFVKVITGGTPGGRALWNGTNNSGYLVGSGVYFYIVTDWEGQHYASGKIAVMRSD